MFISPAYAQTAANGPGGGSAQLLGLIPYIGIFAIFYLLLIRPQMRRQKMHRSMVQAVKKGDTVVTAGGLIGKVTGVRDDEVDVEIAAGTKVKVVKHTIAEVRGPVGTAANDAKA